MIVTTALNIKYEMCTYDSASSTFMICVIYLKKKKKYFLT